MCLFPCYFLWPTEEIDHGCCGIPWTGSLVVSSVCEAFHARVFVFLGHGVSHLFGNATTRSAAEMLNVGWSRSLKRRALMVNSLPRSRGLSIPYAGFVVRTVVCRVVE